MPTTLIGIKNEDERMAFEALIQKHKAVDQPKIFKFKNQYFMLATPDPQNLNNVRIEKLDPNNLPQGVTLPTN